MGERTGISWTDHTFNPWRGCQHATLPDGTFHPGCVNCYAETMSRRNPAVLGTWGSDGARVMATEKYWQGPLKWNREAAAEGRRHRVFCASLADVFEDWPNNVLTVSGHLALVCDQCGRFYVDDDASNSESCDDPECGRFKQRMDWVRLDDLRVRLFRTIAATPWLEWQILTKRPGNVRPMFDAMAERMDTQQAEAASRAVRDRVWLIASVSDQASADAMIPELLKLRDYFPVLGISYEPATGPLDLSFWLGVERWFKQRWHREPGCDPCLDWVIVGGESGAQRRPCEVEWLVNVVRQCKAADVACYVKQDSAQRDGQQGRIPDDVWAIKEFPRRGAAA